MADGVIEPGGFGVDDDLAHARSLPGRVESGQALLAPDLA